MDIPPSMARRPFTDSRPRSLTIHSVINRDIQMLPMYMGMDSGSDTIQAPTIPITIWITRGSTATLPVDLGLAVSGV